MPRLLIACAPVVAIFACSDDTPPIIDVLFCENGCFDGDDCTDDLCQVDGSCLNVPRNPFGACLTDAHCDDANPCSEDRCELDGCALMRCVNVLPDFDAGECRPCGDLFGACDDGNPCTAERCGDDDICIMDPTPDPNCDQLCNQGAAMSADMPLSSGQWFGYQNWYVGTATSLDGVNCGSDACTCEGELRFGDSLDGFALRDARGLNDPEFACDIVACEPRSASCRPLDAGVGYVVWGVISYLNAFEQAPTPQDTSPAPDAGAADVAMPPIQPIDALLVEGYCLSTRLDHVIGEYAGTFESDGQVSTFDLRIESQAAGIVAHMGPCIGCATTGLVADQVGLLGAEIGTVTFPLALDGVAGFARLYAKTDRFVGDLRRDGGGYLGKLTLERLVH